MFLLSSVSCRTARKESEEGREMSKRGPPKHQNRIAWKPNAGHKINETEVGGKLRPYSEITGVCPRCREQIEWKRKYGKYKPLTEPAKCQKCSKRAVRQAYHNLCSACSKELKVCAKCSCRVDNIIGRDRAEEEAEKKMLEEGIKNARERERRTLLRAMSKGKSRSSGKMPPDNDSKAGDLFEAASLEEYAEFKRDDKADCDEHVSKGTSHSSDKTPPANVIKAGDKFEAASLEEYADYSQDDEEDEEEDNNGNDDDDDDDQLLN